MEPSMQVHKRKIVLLGKTANGKSSAGNTILGEKKITTNSATAKCKTVDGMVYGRKITVIDTPGFFDTDHDDRETKSEIIESLIECAPCIDAFIIVLKVGRYTRQEMEVVQQLLSMFEESVLKHVVILFTFGEQLEDQTLEEFMKDNSQLQAFVKKFEDRCHVIDNKYWNDCHSGYKSNSIQIKNLLETIDKMVQENGYYTNQLFQSLEEETAEKVKNKKKETFPAHMTRGILKKIFNIAIRFAGPTKGTLSVALLGIGVAIASGLMIKLFLLKYHK